MHLHMKNGERVALVRYPHGGTFEIPQLTVNNRNREARRMLGTSARQMRLVFIIKLQNVCLVQISMAILFLLFQIKRKTIKSTPALED